MNKKTQILTIFILGFLVASIYFSALTKAVVAPDLLEVNADSYAKGKLLYTNSTHSDVLGAYVNITVENVYNLTDPNVEVIEISINYEIESAEGDVLGIGFVDFFAYTALIFSENRSFLMPAARMIVANDTFWGEVSILHSLNLEDIMNMNLTRFVVDGTTYKFEDIYSGHPQEDIISELYLLWALFNWGLSLSFTRTIFAISPLANVGDTINFFPTGGSVIDLPAVTTSDGKSYDTIHVGYADTFVIGFGDYDDVDCFYEASSGLLIRSIEKDTISGEQIEFQPTEVKIKKSGLLPFPFAGVVVSIIAIGLVVVFIRKKK